MPIGVSSRRSHHSTPTAQLASQSWTSESKSAGRNALEEDEGLQPRSQSHDSVLPRKPNISDSGDDADNEFIDISGPFSVEMLGEEVRGASRTVVHVLRVTGSDGSHVIRRRYQSFAKMSAAVATKSSKPLPAMPPKSFFRKRLSPGFMQERSKCLELLAVAAVDGDPHADDEAVRQFLGLESQIAGEGGDPRARVRVGAVASPWWVRQMSTINEAEFESSVLGSNLLSSLEDSKIETSTVSPETWSVISDTPARQRGPAHLGCVEETVFEEGSFDCLDVQEDPDPQKLSGLLPEVRAPYDHVN